MSNPISNTLVKITLAKFLSLIDNAKPIQIRNFNYCIITQEEKNIIQQCNGWDKVVVIESLEYDEIETLKQLYVIHHTNKDELFFKLTRLDEWQKVYEAELKRQLENSSYRNELIKREQRIKNALTQLVNDLNISYENAEVMMKQMILPGYMMDIAKLLNIHDLCKKQ